MELSAPLSCREGYGIHAVSVDGAGPAGDKAYLVVTGSGSVLRTEHVFEGTRRWLDAWIDSRMAVGTTRRRPDTARNHH